MSEKISVIDKPLTHNSESRCNLQLRDRKINSPLQRSRPAAFSSITLATFAILFSVSARYSSSLPTVAAQTRTADVPSQSNGAAVAQLPAIDMQSPVRASVQAAVVGLQKQAQKTIGANSSSSANDVPATAKSVGLFQGGNCVDPHPGNPQQSQQQVDECHAQIWYKWSDGCTGYRVVPAQSSGGGNCGNSQPASDRITWTFCAVKHSS